MKDKLILNEDLEISDVSYDGQTIQDLYEIMGVNLFDEENIEPLRKAGLISDDGYPVREYENYHGEMVKTELDLGEIWEMDEDFIKSPYIQKLLINELKSKYKQDDSGNIILKYRENDIPKINGLSEDFMRGCFTGDVWEYFNYDPEISFRDCESYFKYIPDEVYDILESYGFPRDIYDKLYSFEEIEDEDNPQSEFYDELEDAMSIAVRQGEESGAERECLDDFSRAWDESIPEGCIDNEGLNYEGGQDYRIIKVTDEWLNNNIKNLWESLGDYSRDICYVFEEVLKDQINENLSENFEEPYSGWYGFDEDAFADRLLDEIMQLEIDKRLIKKEEEMRKASGQMSLFDDDEVDEDFDIEIDKVGKPKKLYYKYKEYQPEISSKAYHLDLSRLSKLIDYFEKDINNKAYCDNHIVEILKDYLEYGDADGIVISATKPSYLPTYGGNHGYTIWQIDDMYESEYLGYIPKHVGDDILNLTEDLEVDILPIPDITIDPHCDYPGIEDFVMNHLDDTNWGIYVLNYRDEERDFEISNVDLQKALDRYNSMRKNGCDKYEEVVLYIYDDEAGEEIPVKSFDADDKLEEEYDPIHYYFVWWFPIPELDPNKEGDGFRTPLITKQLDDKKPTPEEVLAIYNQLDYSINYAGFKIEDAEEVTKEEFEDYYHSADDYSIYDLTKGSPLDSVDIAGDKN